jgi:hypothetical protein
MQGSAKKMAQPREHPAGWMMGTIHAVCEGLIDVNIRSFLIKVRPIWARLIHYYPARKKYSLRSEITIGDLVQTLY